MRASRMRAGGLVLAAALSWTFPARAVVLGQVDDFEDGTTKGWHTGPTNPNPPVNVPDGGPEGTGDAFLRITSNGVEGNPGGRPTANSGSQWTGDYTGAGVVQISADVRNQGVTQLDVRLLIHRNPIPNGPRFFTAPVSVPAGSGWVRATWQVSAANLTPNPVDPIPGDPVASLRDVGEIRIFHSTQPQFPGPALVADLGVDNVRAEGATADRDGDGAADASDNCPFTANADQGDSDQNGRGDACECGDQSGDGTVSVLDLVAINLAIFNPALRTPLCDASGDGDCTVADIVAANVEIFSPGITSSCPPLSGP